MTQDRLEKELAAVRANDFEIHPLIIGRWSPRAFMDKPVLLEDMLAVLEAAHWAPSCFNEQPWRFIVAREAADLLRMRECLAPLNRGWADRAPVLICVLSAPTFAMDGKPNRWHEFDTGTAWGYLALEANARGLITHAMGGFSQTKVRETYQVPETWGIHAVVALGYCGPAEMLPAELKEREHPTERKPLSDLWTEEKFKF